MRKISVQSVFRIAIVGVTIFGTLLLSSGASAGTPPIAYVNYENSSWKTSTSCCKWLYDPWNENNFRIPVQGKSTYRETWISTSIANEGRKSLGIRLKQNPTTKEKQRIEFEISNSNYYTQHLEESRYYGVAVYIHPSSADTLSRGAVFMQAWQTHDTSYSKEPPFSLRFDDNSSYKWSVNMSRDVPGVDNRYTSGTKETIYTSPTGLKKGVWHEFIVWFKPSTQSKGAVRVWHNGTLAVSQTNQKNFGYAPRSSSPTISNSFAVRFGAYRMTGPDYPGEIILMFDQAKYGTSYTSVDP